jgi:hypothetical protein
MSNACGSLVHRFRYTPWRDMLRGRISARYDWRALIAGSALPAEVQQLVTRVVRRTGLWRSERVQVAEELIAHFQDGLEAGRSPAELVASFGDLKLAAKLIRRGKKRNRPWVWRAWERTCQVLGVVVLVYAGLLGLLVLRHPQPRVDYVAKLNEVALSAPEADKAWPIYRKAWIEDHIWDMSDLTSLVLDPSHGRNHLVRPGEPGWEKVGPFLDRHAGLIAAMRAGSARPHLGLAFGFHSSYQGDDRLALFGPEAPVQLPCEPVDGVGRLLAGSIMYADTPCLWQMRRLYDVLQLDLTWASTTGDGARVVADYQAMLGIAGQLREGGVLINQLIGLVSIFGANRRLADALHEHAECFTDAQLIELAHLAGGTPALARITMIGEQAFMLDTIQRIYSDNGRGDGHITLDGLRVCARSASHDESSDERWTSQAATMLATLPVVTALYPSRRAITDLTTSMYAEYEDRAQQPFWVTLHTDGPVKKRLPALKSSKLDVLRYQLVAVLMPALDTCVRESGKAQGVGEALGVALALELYHRRHGKYPATLAELAPQYLPAPPLDISTGEPLLYKLRGGKPLLYGRGLEGKDHGGVWDGSTPWPLVPETGDWVLYPPVVWAPVAAGATQPASGR